MYKFVHKKTHIFQHSPYKLVQANKQGVASCSFWIEQSTAPQPEIHRTAKRKSFSNQSQSLKVESIHAIFEVQEHEGKIICFFIPKFNTKNEQIIALQKPWKQAVLQAEFRATIAPDWKEQSYFAQKEVDRQVQFEMYQEITKLNEFMIHG